MVWDKGQPTRIWWALDGWSWCASKASSPSVIHSEDVWWFSPFTYPLLFFWPFMFLSQHTAHKSIVHPVMRETVNFIQKCVDPPHENPPTSLQVRLRVFCLPPRFPRPPQMGGDPYRTAGRRPVWFNYDSPPVGRASFKGGGGEVGSRAADRRPSGRPSIIERRRPPWMKNTWNPSDRAAAPPNRKSRVRLKRLGSRRRVNTCQSTRKAFEGGRGNDGGWSATPTDELCF